jgi:hypothetical protein
MSYVIAAPEMMTSAAADLATIGSNVDAAHTAAATRTTAVLPAAADEVSASIAHLFSAHAANYQAMAAQAAAFNDQFVQHLTASAGSFAHAEAANTALLQPLTASAASIGNAVAAVPGQALLNDLFNATVGPLITPFATFIFNQPLLQAILPILLSPILIPVILFFAADLLLSTYFPNLFPNLLKGLFYMPFGNGL